MQRVRAVLIDIDGVLTLSWEPVSGAIQALRWLRSAGIPFVLVTNTTSRSRAQIADRLEGQGFPIGPADILTAPAIGAAYLRERYPGARCLLINSGDIAADLPGVTLTQPGDPAVDVVLIGGAGPEFSYDALNRAFRHLRDGARLVALSRGLYWRTREGLQLDTGAFLPGLEEAGGTAAEVVGKPASEFFAAALAHLEASASDALMIGDDIDNDVLAAQRCGLTGVLVRTGKFAPRTLSAAIDRPDYVVDSIADLPSLLERPS